MKIVPPIAVTPDNLTSNVPITETEWTAGTYTLGQQRYVGTDLYEVLVASTTDEPTAGAAKTSPTWVKVGKINRYKMFDFSIGDATTKSGDIIVGITPNFVANAVALFEVAATSIQVTVTDPIAGLVYDKTVTLSEYTGINNYYSYFFEPYALATDAIFLDLPNYSAAEIEITISNTSAQTKVGEVVIGRIQTLGVTLMDIQLGIQDYSRKERDQFGKVSIVERRFAKTVNYGVFLENGQVNSTYRLLAQYRATPVLYVGDENKPETALLGFYRDFNVLRSGPSTSEMTLEIEGLV